MSDNTQRTLVWVPGKFTPASASRPERLWLAFCPPGWEILPSLALLAPGVLLEYILGRGNGVIGTIGLFVWAPLLWLALVVIHHAGRVRIWLSAPVFLLAHLAIGLWFIGTRP